MSLHVKVIEYYTINFQNKNSATARYTAGRARDMHLGNLGACCMLRACCMLAACLLRACCGLAAWLVCNSLYLMHYLNVPPKFGSTRGSPLYAYGSSPSSCYLPNMVEPSCCLVSASTNQSEDTD